MLADFVTICDAMKTWNFCCGTHTGIDCSGFPKRSWNILEPGQRKHECQCRDEEPVRSFSAATADRPIRCIRRTRDLAQ